MEAAVFRTRHARAQHKQCHRQKCFHLSAPVPVELSAFPKEHPTTASRLPASLNASFFQSTRGVAKPY